MLNNFGSLIYQVWEVLLSPFLMALNQMLNELGWSEDLHAFDINIGFGQIVWFTGNLEDLIIIVFGITMTVIFLIVVFKLFKWFSSLFGNLFRGYRK